MDPGLLSRRYQIVRPIGSGDATSVLEAWDRVACRPVAVKVPVGRFANDKAFLVRLEREVAALAGFTHPNIAPVHTVERGGGFVVAALVDGSSLRAMLAARGPLPPLGAARVTAQVCAALVAAHSRGIVHGHLTAANALLTRDGRVQVTDFRLAQAARPLASAADPGADLRALGRLLAAMLTGREPADGEPVRLDPTVPPELVAIVRRADGPEHPYRLAAEFSHDLDCFLASAAPAGQLSMPPAQDATDVLATPGPSRPAELLPSPTGSRQPPVGRGVTPPSTRRRRGLAVAARPIVVGVVVLVAGTLAGVRLLGGQPDGAAVSGSQATAAPWTVAGAATTSRPQPATSTNAASTTVTSRAPVTTAQPSIATPATAPPPPTTTGQLLGPGQRIVPDVVGLHSQQAAHVLAQAGLAIQIVPVSTRDPGQVQRVIAQQPPAGQAVPAGSEVTVLVGTSRPPSL